ncbi:MAG: YraN family protein [Pseudomonadota bacterium]
MWKWLTTRSKPRASALTRGAAGEQQALDFLHARGLKLIARNFRARGGELDLVMDDRGTLAVIEVRARSKSRHGHAAETVDARKQRRVILATQVFLAAHPQFGQSPLRFDIVALDADVPPVWLRGAFDATDQ